MDRDTLVLRLEELERKVAQLMEALEQPDTIPAPPVRTTWQKVAGAFSKRYQSIRKLAWNPSPHVTSLDAVAMFIDQQAAIEGGDVRAIGARLLDAFFSDPYAKKLDYPPGLLAKKCGTYYNPPAVSIEDEPDAEAINAKRIRERRLQEQRELEAKLNGNAESACKPPPLEELTQRLMQKWG